MVIVPGMQCAVSAAGQADLHVHRARPNLWWLTIGGGGNGVAAGDGVHGTLPSQVLASGNRTAPVTLAKVELDACGAWITLANADALRPVVVRRAGWVDVRGHPYEPAHTLRDDRVGLGPGDAVVFARPARGDTASDLFLDCLLTGRGEPEGLRDVAVEACGSPNAPVVVLGVPSELGPDPHQRVADAIGVPAEDLDLPGYPLGDLQPELWAEPPRPPRLARLEIRDATSVRQIRSLLDRLIASWRLSDRLVEHDIKLAASELATNAVIHSGKPETATVRLYGQGIRIEVDDRSAALPMLRDAPDALGGRGLRVVDAVASSWGVETRPVGKRVWCEISLA
jgi:anti-sigma regulatory factor (Ser/Thr protein kinase)